MAWTPGHRRVPPGLKRKVGDHMWSIGLFGNITVRLFSNPDNKPAVSDIEDDTLVEQGENFVLAFQRGPSKFGINLSEMKTEELDEFKKILDHAIEEARRVTTLRDRIAHESMDSGEDLYYRSLRTPGKATIFRRSEREYHQGVHGGHQDDVGGAGPSGDDRAGGPGGPGRVVAEQ